MNFKGVIDGLNIFRKYFDDETGYHLGGEHDALHVYKTDRPISEKDLKSLDEMGWFQSSEDTEIAGDEWTVSDYNPSAPWVAFV